MDTLQWIVLVAASVIALVGAGAVVWRELGAPTTSASHGRARLTLEVVLPGAGLVALVAWIWTG